MNTHEVIKIYSAGSGSDDNTQQIISLVQEKSGQQPPQEWFQDTPEAIINPKNLQQEKLLHSGILLAKEGQYTDLPDRAGGMTDYSGTLQSLGFKRIEVKVPVTDPAHKGKGNKEKNVAIHLWISNDNSLAGFPKIKNWHY